MNRYTYMENRHWRVKIGEEEIRAGFVDRLADYENLDLAPGEIKQQFEKLRGYRHVCGRHSPEYVQHAIRVFEGYEQCYGKMADIIEEALDTLTEVGNGVTDEMLYELLQKLFILRDILENKIGHNCNSFVEECAERAKRVLHKEEWEEAEMFLPDGDAAGGEGARQ